MRLKQKDIKTTREDLLKQQSGLCAVCGTSCAADPVLDHDHKTGVIRATLHRGCNALLGKVENNAARNGVSKDRLPDVLRGLASYLEAHSSDQTGLTHPTHKTPGEKAARARKRRRARSKKAAH